MITAHKGIIYLQESSRGEAVSQEVEKVIMILKEVGLAIIDLTKRLISKYNQRIENKRGMEQIRRLPEYLLNDIGLTRGDLIGRQIYWKKF